MKKIRSSLSIILAVIMVLSVFVVVPITSSAATAHTQSEAVNWIKAKANDGWWQDVDGAYGCQCVDLIKAYYQYFGYAAVQGNAWEYKSGHLPAGSNWSYSGTPKPGSVFVKDKDSTWTMGHVGLVYAVEGSTIYTVETNVASPYDGGHPYAKAQYRTHPISYAVTFINPTFSSAPVVADTQSPTVSNIYQNDYNDSGYTLHFTAVDNVELGYATVYTNVGTQHKEERVNLSGTNQSVSYRVRYSDFSNVRKGYVHGIWVFDKTGNVCKSPWINVYNDDELPVISKVYASDFTDTGFNLVFTASDNKELQKAIVYTNVNDKDQKGQEIKLSGKTQTVSQKIKYSDFKNAKSGYKHGIWLYDKFGNVKKSPWIYTENETEEPIINDVKILNITDEGYTLNYSVSDNSSLSYVRVFTWTKASNQKSVDISLEGKSATLSYSVRYKDFDNDKTGYIHGIWLFDGNGNKHYSPYLYVDEMIKNQNEETQSITNIPTVPAYTDPIVTEPITPPVVTDPTQPSIPKPTLPKVTAKKANPIKVSVKTKTVKLKKLKKKAQKVKAITVKNAQGKVTYKLVKSGIINKIRKLCKINSKGVITIKKWKKAKKGTYKIKVKVTAAGNSNYNAKAITKTIKIKIK